MLSMRGDTVADLNPPPLRGFGGFLHVNMKIPTDPNTPPPPPFKIFLDLPRRHEIYVHI